MIKIITCKSCGKTFEFKTNKGGRTPNGCSSYCKNKLERISQNTHRRIQRKKEKEADIHLPTVQEALDWYKDKKHNLSGDPNMMAEIFSL